MNFNKFTIKAQEAVQGALELAASRNHQALEPGHLLKSLIKDDQGVTTTILKKIEVSVQRLDSELDKMLKKLPVVQGAAVSGQYL